MEYWRKCSSCKKPIGFGVGYYVCNVSTCNRKRTGLVFCTVPCWDAHVPLMNHKEAWSTEKTSPNSAEEAETIVPTPRPAPTARPTEAPMESGNLPKDVLVVVSKLKAYIKAKSDGMSTSADVNEALSNKIRVLCDTAIINAKQSGRKTVMARDF